MSADSATAAASGAAAAPSRIEQRDLLIELGTEELPPKALRTLELAFAQGIETRIKQAGLTAKAVESFATPRRLAVLVRRLPVRTPDGRVKGRGPPLSKSFEADGTPTRAASAFAQRYGVSVAELGRETDPKGAEYLCFEGLKRGTPTADLLAQWVQQALDALPIPRRMRWGAGEAQFVRPVHWLVLLFGSEVVAANILGVAAGDLSVGHRFMAPAALRIRTPQGYAAALRTRGKVMASFGERRETIRAQVDELAASFTARAIVSEALLEEVTALVEWPVPIAGTFEARFLQLPREVLLSTLQAHQRYFALENDAGELLPRFITISNIESLDPDQVRDGNERVVRPRLSDAAFFWEQDRRAPLAAYRAGLDAVTFEAQLGSLGARTERIAALTDRIAQHIGADRSCAARAAQLAKCDLLSAMVGEFPELQGIMGRYYALADGERALIADAIRDHYLPRAAGDALPQSPVGDAVALAEKLDTLAGIFAIGKKPSGTSDPYGLRRAAIGLLRIVLEHRLELNLIDLIGHALRLQPLADIEQRAVAVCEELYTYIVERLRAQLLERADENRISTEMFDAVLARRPASLLDIEARLKALVGFVARAEGASLAATNKRIANILRKSDPAQSQPLAAPLLREPAERELFEALLRLRTQVEAALKSRNYVRALDLLAQLTPSVDAFFEGVLVNDPDAALRANRLALLATLRELFCGVADLSRLPG